MITDEMIAEAAAELNQALIDSLPDPHECKHQFSKKFERKMEKLIQRTNHPIQHAMLNCVASVLLVIIIGFAMVMTFSPTARAAVVGWIKETYGRYYSYYFDTDVVQDDNFKYQIDQLPEGYAEISYVENNGFHMYIYSNEEAMLVFSYAEGPDPNVLYVEKEGCLIEESIVNGKMADLYISEDGTKPNEIFWCDPESGCIFYISGYFDGERLKILAESVKLVS